MLQSLGGIFKQKNQDLVGVDIGTSAIKIVHLESRGEKKVLKGFAIARLKEGLIQSSNQTIAAQQISKILSLALEKSFIKCKTVSFSIPSFSSFISFITIPKSFEEELESKIEIEARKYIPVPLSEILLGWEIISENEKIKSMDSKEERIKILLMAVAKDVVKKYETIARNSKVNLGSIEVESLSLIRCLAGKEEDATLIIDIGSRVCNMIVVQGGFLKAHRNLDVGGGDISEAIARGMKVDFIRAESLKKDLEITDPQFSSLIIPIIARIKHEVKRMLEMFDNSNPNNKIQKVVIVGGTAKLKGFLDYLEEDMSIKVVEGDPWSRVRYNKKNKNILESFKHELSVAIGMAMGQ